MRPDNALRMNYDYECITIAALRKPSPRLTRAPGFASGATERTGAAFRPDGAMIQDQGPDPRGVLQQSGGVGRLCLSGRLRTAQEASKRGMGAEPPCKPRPRSQDAFYSRRTGRHEPPSVPAPCKPTRYQRSPPGAGHNASRHHTPRPRRRAPHHRQTSASPRTRHASARSRPSGPPRPGRTPPTGAI